MDWRSINTVSQMWLWSSFERSSLDPVSFASFFETPLVVLPLLDRRPSLSSPTWGSCENLLGIICTQSLTTNDIDGSGEVVKKTVQSRPHITFFWHRSCHQAVAILARPLLDASPLIKKGAIYSSTVKSKGLISESNSRLGELTSHFLQEALSFAKTSLPHSQMPEERYWQRSLKQWHAML